VVAAVFKFRFGFKLQLSSAREASQPLPNSLFINSTLLLYSSPFEVQSSFGRSRGDGLMSFGGGVGGVSASIQIEFLPRIDVGGDAGSWALDWMVGREGVEF